MSERIIPTAIPIPAAIVRSSSAAWFYLNQGLNAVPGGHHVLNYIEKSSHDDPYRTAIEAGLILYGIYYYLSKPQRKRGLQANRPNLTEREKDALIDEWEPEPLVVPPVNDHETAERYWRLAKIPVVENGGIATYIDFTRNNRQESFEHVLNLASNNFLTLSQTEEVLDVARDTINNYGVGACGPAGFYGNQDVHYNCEYMLSDFFGTDACCLYGQDFAVASSVVPAFTKRGDVIVADDKVSLAVQNALQLARCTVYYFQHNNMESLDELLQQLNEQEKKEKLPAIPRKFIVTEGLFHNSGDIAPLPELVDLKNKYKYRLFVDETMSLGVLGATGRGLPEHFGLERASSIDITVGSMATAFGSSGGFVLGDKYMSNYQHIGSNAYCFSASLPGYTTTVVSKCLQIMDADNSQVKHLQELSRKMFYFFTSRVKLNEYFTLTSSEFSPVLHLELKEAVRAKRFGYTRDTLFAELHKLQGRKVSDVCIDPYEAEEMFLQQLVDDVLVSHNVLISRHTIVLKQETLPIVPSLRISCTAGMTEEELLGACENIATTLVQRCESA
ncbi:serine C-palmitoyltransferase [Maudiozyma humilis]|uniref:serine C-palmitoyltransferase n=1 Tax=Maudiozyma humilis TaxID=51915 RepID=A0AAV5RU93_MAUHU|nr:serine C-palmitoyltransferase [Kazachstania humilis]